MIKNNPRHTSVVQSKNARSMILTKIIILEKWANNGIPWKRDINDQIIHDTDGEKILDYYPRNRSNFCTWNAQKNCEYTRSSLKKFTSNSRDTLRRSSNKDLSNRLDRALANLKAKAKLQLELSNKTSLISTLEAEIKYWRTIAESLTSERIQFTETLAKEKKEKSIRTEMQKRNEQELKRQLQMLEDKNSALTKQLKLVSPIKGAK